jgi:hypothetical protein
MQQNHPKELPLLRIYYYYDTLVEMFDYNVDNSVGFDVFIGYYQSGKNRTQPMVMWCNKNHHVYQYQNR